MQLFRCSIGRHNPNPLCTRVTFEALMRASTNQSLVAWTACLRLDLNTQSSAWEVSGSNTTPPGTNKPANLQVFGAFYGTMHIKFVIWIFDVAVWWDVTVTNTHHFTWWQLKILTADHDRFNNYAKCETGILSNEGPKAPSWWYCGFARWKFVEHYCATTYSGVIRPRDHIYRSRGTVPVDRVS